MGRRRGREDERWGGEQEERARVGEDERKRGRDVKKIVNENSSNKKLKPTFKFCVRICRLGNLNTRFNRLLLDSDFYLNPLA